MDRTNETVERAARYAAKRYMIDIIVVDSVISRRNAPWKLAPSVEEAINHDDMAIMTTGRDWIQVIHEIEHLVWWHNEYGVYVRENLMMPVGIGMLREFGVPASYYMRHPYCAQTMITDCFEDELAKRSLIMDWKHPTRSAWYRRAQQANIAAGVIDERGLPTWRYPDWSRVNYAEHEL